MAQQIPVDDTAVLADEQDDGMLAVAPDIAYRRLLFVNVVYLGTPGQDGWVLVDTGVPGMAERIRGAARERFGDVPPRAIVLTHGHFDHVGTVETLADQWDVPVYAHPLERPYLDGSAAYPKADPGVGGGLMTLLSPLYPRSPVDVGTRLRDILADGGVPEFPGWRWLHTPGHPVGHVSLWREADRSLIAGDAFHHRGGRKRLCHGHPGARAACSAEYFTHDWQAAEQSVCSLADLQPECVVTGHGRARCTARPCAGHCRTWRPTSPVWLCRQAGTTSMLRNGRRTAAPTNRPDIGGGEHLPGNVELIRGGQAEAIQAERFAPILVGATL